MPASKPLRPFGVAVYRPGASRDDSYPIEVTHEELLALKAFDLVWFFGKPAPGMFRVALDKEQEFDRFLKQYRAGQR